MGREVMIPRGARGSHQEAIPRAHGKPTRRKAPGPSYSILDVAIAVVLVAVMVTALWGLGCAYQAGYANGVRYAQEFAR